MVKMVEKSSTGRHQDHQEDAHPRPKNVAPPHLKNDVLLHLKDVVTLPQTHHKDKEGAVQNVVNLHQKGAVAHPRIRHPQKGEVQKSLVHHPYLQEEETGLDLPGVVRGVLDPHSEGGEDDEVFLIQIHPKENEDSLIKISGCAAIHSKNQK